MKEQKKLAACDIDEIVAIVAERLGRSTTYTRRSKYVRFD